MSVQGEVDGWEWYVTGEASTSSLDAARYNISVNQNSAETYISQLCKTLIAIKENIIQTEKYVFDFNGTNTYTNIIIYLFNKYREIFIKPRKSKETSGERFLLHMIVYLVESKKAEVFDDGAGSDAFPGYYLTRHLETNLDNLQRVGKHNLTPSSLK